MSCNFFKRLLDDVFGQELTVAQFTDLTSEAHLSSTFVELALTTPLMLEVARLGHAQLAAGLAAEVTVTVFELFGVFPWLATRVATFSSVRVVARVDRSLHEEDALLLIKCVLHVTDAERLACLQQHVYLVQRLPNSAVSEVCTIHATHG